MVKVIGDLEHSALPEYLTKLYLLEISILRLLSDCFSLHPNLHEQLKESNNFLLLVLSEIKMVETLMAKHDK